MNKDIYSKGKAASNPWLLLWVFLVPLGLFGQQNPLNRKIDVSVRQVRLDQALDAIEDAGRFNFSYNAEILPLDSSVSLNARNKSVRGVMDDLLGDRMTYYHVGNHLVIRARELAPAPVEPPVSFMLDGYLIDAASGEKVRFATVYESQKHGSTLTDGDGHYHIEVPGTAREVALSFSKRGFHDTVIVIRPDRSPQLTVGLRPYPNYNVPMASREVNIVGDRMPEPLPLVDWLVSEQQRQMAENLEGPLKAFPIQISFIPAFGTNKLLSGGMNNHFSLNVLVGYSNGLRGVEIGGLVNIDREDVIGCQIGGLVNVVGGKMSGVQVGGLVNVVGGDVKGVQIGGLVNVDKGSVAGLQIAGLVNITPQPVKGAQIAGLYNQAIGDVRHLQIGGVTNIASGSVGGFQIGGIANYAKGNVGGFQIGGIANYAKGDVGGFQIGGIVNYATGKVGGFQIGGIVNKADYLKGFQIGLVNVADSIKGIQIGLFNFVRHGYTAFDFGLNETFQFNLAYRAGRRGFHTILGAGLRLGPREPALAYGAGLGTMVMLGAFSIGLDAMCYHVAEGGHGFEELHLLIPGRLSLGFNLGPLELYAGPSANLLITGQTDADGEFDTVLGSRPFWTNEGQNTLLKAWMGWQAGVRVRLWK